MLQSLPTNFLCLFVCLKNHLFWMECNYIYCLYVQSTFIFAIALAEHTRIWCKFYCVNTIQLFNYTQSLNCFGFLNFCLCKCLCDSRYCQKWFPRQYESGNETFQMGTKHPLLLVGYEMSCSHIESTFPFSYGYGLKFWDFFLKNQNCSLKEPQIFQGWLNPEIKLTEFLNLTHQKLCRYLTHLGSNKALTRSQPVSWGISLVFASCHGASGFSPVIFWLT